MVAFPCIRGLRIPVAIGGTSTGETDRIGGDNRRVRRTTM
jgi:hypothetical protein